MAGSDNQERRAGHVQIDDAYLGGEINGAKAGRGSPNKVSFVAAVAVNETGNPIHLKLSPLATFTRESIARCAKLHLSPGSVVTSDGLACFAGVTDAGFIHAPFVVGQLKAEDVPLSEWVNTILGNLKTTCRGHTTRSDSAPGLSTLLTFTPGSRLMTLFRYLVPTRLEQTSPTRNLRRVALAVQLGACLSPPPDRDLGTEAVGAP